MHLFGRSESKPEPIVEQASAPSTYDKEEERTNALEILAQAKWILEQHQERDETATKRAAAILTLTGTIAALTPKGLPDHLTCSQKAWLALILASTLLTITFCILVLRPRQRPDALPSIAQLRRFANAYDKGEAIPIPSAQFTKDLLRSGDLNNTSPLESFHRAADERMQNLGHAYTSFGITFMLVVILIIGQSIFA